MHVNAPTGAVVDISLHELEQLFLILALHLTTEVPPKYGTLDSFPCAPGIIQWCTL